MTASLDHLEIEERDYCLSVKEGWSRRVNAPARSRPPDMNRAELDGRRGGSVSVTTRPARCGTPTWGRS
jgi:hypothetical protein